MWNVEDSGKTVTFHREPKLNSEPKFHREPKFHHQVLQLSSKPRNADSLKITAELQRKTHSDAQRWKHSETPGLECG